MPRNQHKTLRQDSQGFHRIRKIMKTLSAKSFPFFRFTTTITPTMLQGGKKVSKLSISCLLWMLNILYT